MSTIKRRIHFDNVELLRPEAGDQVEPVAATAVARWLHALTATPQARTRDTCRMATMSR